MKIVWIPDH